MQFVGDDAHIVPKSTQISVGNAVLSVPHTIPKSALSGTPTPAHFAVKTRLYSHCPYEYSLSI